MRGGERNEGKGKGRDIMEEVEGAQGAYGPRWRGCEHGG